MKINIIPRRARKRYMYDKYSIPIIINWNYYKKKPFNYFKILKIIVGKSFQGFNFKNKKNITTELLPGSKRQKCKITHKYFWCFLFFQIGYEKIKIMQKDKLRSLFKKAGL